MNYFGQLGTNDKSDKWTPTLVSFFSTSLLLSLASLASPLSSHANTAEKEEINKISISANHTIILTKTGKLYLFGLNYFGQLGTGDRVDQCNPTLVALINVEYQHLAYGCSILASMLNAGKEEIINVVAAYNHTMVTTTSGKLYAFGDNDMGQLGTGDTINKYTPTLIAFPYHVSFISAGSFHTAIITDKGKLYTCGNNRCGQLGTCDTINRRIFTAILPNENVRTVCVGTYHTIVSTNDNKIYTFGRNTRGQLGVGDRENRSSPTLVDL
jgi:alpha-tubulin suppressor-like RCC1 family protein